MATTTQVVCDACGLGNIGTRGEVEGLNLEVTNSLSVQMDVHNSARCIARAVKTAVEKHFNTGGQGK